MTLSDQIIQVLNYLGEKFGIAIDWTSENVIPYITTLCTKLISYEIWTSVAWIAIMAILSIIGIVIAAKFRVFSSDFLDEFDIGAVFLCAGLFVIWVGTVICIGCQVFDIIKCVTFPEMYVFEYIQTLIESAK